MPVTMNVSETELAGLERLIEANPSIDWRQIALDAPRALEALVWCELEPAAMEPLLKAYQRLARILPASEERRALRLLERGLHSAIQIANLSRDEFVRCWSELFPGESALGLAVHGAALGRRSELLLRHVDNIQRNEPHYRAARFK
jgi:hypothetical protein